MEQQRVVQRVERRDNRERDDEQNKDERPDARGTRTVSSHIRAAFGHEISDARRQRPARRGRRLESEAPRPEGRGALTSGWTDLTRSRRCDDACSSGRSLDAQLLLHGLTADGDRHEVIAGAHERRATAAESAQAERGHEVVAAEAAAARGSAGYLEELRHLLQGLKSGCAPPPPPPPPP